MVGAAIRLNEAPSAKWYLVNSLYTTPSVQKILLCPIHCKPNPSEVRLGSLELENIPQVPRNRAEVGQNHDARKAVSATL